MSARPTRTAVQGEGNISRGTRRLSHTQQLSEQDFAFPRQRKEPLSDARHVRNAIARFDQVQGVSDAERDEAWQRITDAARRCDVNVSESSWRDLVRS